VLNGLRESQPLRFNYSTRKFKFRKYFRDLNRTFANVKQDPAWGKNFVWPVPPPVLANASELLHKVHANWRAKMMITSLTPEQQAFMRQKVLALTLFKGKKPWNVPRNFDADYLELDSNPHKAKYIEAMQRLFSTYGDTEVCFADYVNKVNKGGKSQKRGIVVTEKNIYKHDPKNYKVKKFGTPIVDVKSISLSSKKDSFLIIHAKEPHRDLVLDLGIEGSPEKYSEFVTVLVQEYKKLTGTALQVNFNDRITFNNSRANQKPGVDCVLTFEMSSDMKLKGCVFKTGKGNTNVIQYQP